MIQGLRPTRVELTRHLLIILTSRASIRIDDRHPAARFAGGNGG
jgi:hypothetical protein